jgi:hypothetical protein
MYGIALLCLVSNVSRGTNRADIRETVYAMLSADSTNRILTTTRLNTFINEGIIVLSSDARCITATKRVVLSRLTNEYYIDSTMVKDGVIDCYVKYMDAGILSGVLGLAKRDMSEFGRSGENTVNVYDIIGYNIYLYGLPTTDDEEDSLIVMYAKRGTELADDTTNTTIPDDYRLALCYKVCELVYGNRRLEQVSTLYAGLYDKEISKKRSLNPPDSLQPVVPNR